MERMLHILISQRAAPFQYNEKQIRREIFSAIDIGLLRRKRAGLLEVEQVIFGKGRRRVENSVGMHAFPWEQKLIHTVISLYTGLYEYYTRKANIMLAFAKISPYRIFEDGIYYKKYPQ